MAAGPRVTIYLLGDPECGKRTFLTRLLDAQSPTLGHATPQFSRPLENPQNFSVRLFNRPYTFEVHRVSCSNDIDLSVSHLPEPDLIVFTFSVVDRPSLASVRDRWHRMVAHTFSHLEDRLPLILVGLQRDLRNSRPQEEMVLPMEGHKMAQQIGADNYAECSAMIGELMWEVLEDITKIAAKTTTKKGGKSEESSCVLM